MAWLECDSCKSDKYSDDNPFVEYRQQRPSDHSCMTCVLAGHKNCISSAVTRLPAIGNDGGIATPDQWEEWIEGDGAKAGYAFLD